MLATTRRSVLASLATHGARAAAVGAQQRNISIRGADNSRWGRTRENWDSVLDRFAKVNNRPPRMAMFCCALWAHAAQACTSCASGQVSTISPRSHGSFVRWPGIGSRAFALSDAVPHRIVRARCFARLLRSPPPRPCRQQLTAGSTLLNSP